MMINLPTLLATGSPRPPDKMAANDMSPAGAVYLGLLLLRQKMTNPAWFGDPDAQNKQWTEADSKRQPASKVVNMMDEPQQQTDFRIMLQKGLSNERSPATKAYQAFLTNLGIKN
jgi:hypothetical protein